MPSLRELQVEVMEALLTGSAERAIPLIDGPRDRSLARLRVYENAVHANYEDALASSFPATKRLVGDDYFLQTARELQRRHPSRSGDLVHIGRPFPGYLAGLHHESGFEYLADVARLEWFIQEVLLAADFEPLDLARLARVDPAEYDGLRFELNPALRVFESPYPALAIWEANVGSDGAALAIDLRSGGDRLIVVRRHLQLEFHRLSLGEHCFLAAVGRGESFAAAVDSGGAGDPGFDAPTALQRFVAAEAVVDFRILKP